ncbi:hypothetical protein QBC36DRAFT_319939 [Triangularia setosa]|uniref:Uncharacterized protein n=1 Tax=Triangularia setosa TaxID=2587417 RepID=A0AAN6WEH7_9PEZI|nr:hypothetical protein QBC36DRAFT_319939 [Podospora setosa]
MTCLHAAPALVLVRMSPRSFSVQTCRITASGPARGLSVGQSSRRPVPFSRGLPHLGVHVVDFSLTGPGWVPARSGADIGAKKLGMDDLGSSSHTKCPTPGSTSLVPQGAPRRLWELVPTCLCALSLSGAQPSGRGVREKASPKHEPHGVLGMSALVSRRSTK